MGNIEIDFSDGFEDAILDQARRAMAEMEFDYECPECGADMKVKAGESRACPSCGFVIEAEIG